MRIAKKSINYLSISDALPIARRYFVMNGFDGILTILGLLIGAYLAGIRDPHTILISGMGASIAMGVSGSIGTYLTEHAEREREIREIENYMLENLGETIHHRAQRFSSYFLAMVDGFSPLATGTLILSFFLIGPLLDIEMAILYSMAFFAALLLLFAFGIYLGSISEENRLNYGFKMVLAGFIVIVACAPLTVA
ncbi:MAG: VIT1/CCC1 transporter family protein [Candidatus Hodarchaeota archaeon]